MFKLKKKCVIDGIRVLITCFTMYPEQPKFRKIWYGVTQEKYATDKARYEANKAMYEANKAMYEAERLKREFDENYKLSIKAAGNNENNKKEKKKDK